MIVYHKIGIIYRILSNLDSNKRQRAFIVKYVRDNYVYDSVGTSVTFATKNLLYSLQMIFTFKLLSYIKKEIFSLLKFQYLKQYQ